MISSNRKQEGEKKFKQKDEELKTISGNFNKKKEPNRRKTNRIK